MKTVVVQGQQKWECHSVSVFSESAMIDALNEAGQEGWEPFTACYYKDFKGSMVWTVLLKRPSTGQPQKSAASETTGTPAKVEPQKAEPGGFDLSGDTFDVKTE